MCELGQVGGKKLSFVKRALWQVESELAEDLREALIDFSKLVAGSAPQRLLVGPRVSDSKLGEWLDCLSAPARECSAATYAAFIPHPREWSPGSGLEVDLYRFGGDEWHHVGR
ncbi:MAG: hypothetical protein M5U26_11790 [Planctomycetota bacterium]|nr:hypothetical protein [Planctomycetota bacterium]